jgi:hypothetical protein
MPESESNTLNLNFGQNNRLTGIFIQDVLTVRFVSLTNEVNEIHYT